MVIEPDPPAPEPPPEPVVPPVIYQAYLEALTPSHVAGWARNLSDAAERPEFEVVLSHTGEVVLRSQAGLFLPGLREIEAGDGRYGFHARLPRTLSAEELQHADVRLCANGESMERVAWLVREYRPIHYVIMDIVDNCNLRCPFCVYDYAKVHTTNVMSEATFDAALRFAPYLPESGFWFSCLHEPSLHPQLAEYIARVPREQRRKVFYTTNLAKRMPDEYFELLAESGLHHINISIESLDPVVYERMRKGARFRIFKDNWDRLVPAFARGTAPPRLRYISLAYKSNYRELPQLVEHLLNERGGAEVEIRHTYDVPHIPADFRAREYLDRDEWFWLRDALAHHAPEQVLLVLPPGLDSADFANDASVSEHERVADQSIGGAEAAAAEAAAAEALAAEATNAAAAPAPGGLPDGFLPGSYGLRVFWDGRLEVSRVWGDQRHPHPGEVRLLTTNVRDIRDVDRLFDALPI